MTDVSLFFRGRGCDSPIKRSLCHGSSLKILEEQSWSCGKEIRSLCPAAVFNRSTKQREHLSPNLLLCCTGGGSSYRKKASQNKLSYPPSSPKSKKMCSDDSIFFFFFKFVCLFHCGAEIRRHPSWPPSATWRFHYGPAQCVHRLHQTAHKGNARQIISCYLHE